MISSNYYSFASEILYTIESYFNDYDNKKHSILVLEGKTDANFFIPLLNSSVFELEGKFIRFNLDEHSVVAFGLDTPFYLKSCYDLEEMKAHKFVIEVMKEYYKNIKFHSEKLLCYGIYDFDLTGHDIGLLDSNYISVFKFRDREASLLRDYLPSMFQKYIFGSGRNINVANLSNTLCLCMEQGIMEKASIEFRYPIINVSNDEYYGILQNITQTNFKREERVRNFDIDINGREDLKRFDTFYFSGSRIFGFKNTDFYNRFIVYYRKLRNTILGIDFYTSIEKVIDKWIKGAALDEKSCTMMDKIFSYGNGHYLVNQLLANGHSIGLFDVERIYKTLFEESIIKPEPFVTSNNYDYSRISLDKKFIYILRDDIILNNNEFIRLFCNNPYFDYKKFRLNRLLYTEDSQKSR